MPRLWYDRHAANKSEGDAKFQRNIVADKKPYFMRYIYPMLSKQYNTYIKNTDKNALREFQMTVAELKAISENDLTERQAEFLKYYKYRMPVGINACIMNKICWRFENEFDGHIGKHNSAIKFDYSIMRSEDEYTTKQFNSIKRLYEDYNKRLVNYAIFADYERIDDCDSFVTLSVMNDEFRKECYKVCPNASMLCNIILDICYTRSSTKRFAWNMCGSEIIHNLLIKNDNKISYPTLDCDGDIEFCGNKFIVETTEFEVDE